jgi:hypothetical protein
MGFYLRKSLRMGPVRFNLSKGGVGISAGVRGARIGLSSKRGGYVHAGRGGIYLRQPIGGSHRSRAVTGHRAHGREPIVIVEDTGATYKPKGSHRDAPRLRNQVNRTTRPVMRYHLLPIGAVLILVALLNSEQDIALLGGLIFISLVLVVAWPILVWRSWRSNTAGTKLGEIFLREISTGKPLTADQKTRIEAALQNRDVTSEDRDYYLKIGYLKALEIVFEDRVINDEELELLAQCEHYFSLSPEFCREARLELFSAFYFEAIYDHDLSSDEEAILDHLRNVLSISASTITDEIETIGQLKRLRAIRNGEVPEIDTSEPLQKSERCHFEHEGRMLKEKTLKTFQREGEKYQIRGFVIDKEGTLLITNKRLLMIDDRTTSIQLNKISDVDVDYDQNLITITKHGVQTPTYVSTPDSMRAAAIIASAAGL